MYTGLRVNPTCIPYVYTGPSLLPVTDFWGSLPSQAKSIILANPCICPMLALHVEPTWDKGRNRDNLANLPGNLIYVPY
jgi:hypothetical protein